MNPDDSRTCGSCGKALAPGASFCRSCGARYEQPTCNACQAPLVPGTAFCRACGAPVGGAGQAATPPDPEPTVVRPRPSGPPPHPATPQAPRGNPQRTALLIAAAILLLGGGVAALVLTGGGDDSPTSTVAAESSASDSSGGEEAAAEADESEFVEAEEDGFPAASRPEMEEEIDTLLLAYHEDVVERDFRSAWALLSARKRQQNLAEYGYGKWKQGQASLSDDLYPAGLRARIDALEDDGVARVLVTGMDWTAPGASCVEWSGLTWVRYERGEWTYDPGYSTTGSRRRAWKPRSSELLGADC